MTVTKGDGKEWEEGRRAEHPLCGKLLPHPACWEAPVSILGSFYHLPKQRTTAQSGRDSCQAEGCWIPKTALLVAFRQKSKTLSPY